MKRTGEETLKTRQALLDAAMSVFLDVGYSDSCIEDIASRAGVTRGAFYHHFDSKPAIYYALLEDRNQPAQRILNALADNPSPAPEVLRRLVSDYLRLIATDSSFRQVHELVALKSAFVPELSDGWAQKVQGQRATVDVLARLIERGVGAGQLRRGLNPRNEAAILYAALSGLVMSELIDPGSLPLAERHGALARRLISPLLPERE